MSSETTPPVQPIVERKVTTTTTASHRIELDPNDIRGLLAAVGVEVPLGATFEVAPNYGCSDLPAEVESDNQLVITWSTTEVT